MGPTCADEHIGLALEESDEYEKADVVVLASGHAAPALAILRRTCTHETHAETALGEASARSARYPPALNVALADVIEEVCMQEAAVGGVRGEATARIGHVSGALPMGLPAHAAAAPEGPGASR